jgi:translation initiation factor IF-2
MEKNLKARPPIVVVVGHVDHGKTSLLDAIRKTTVTKREAGGITQSIGASVATTKDGKEITFIDTPGHALFHHMRSRGINLADIGILVVAADDGVQPQTREAIKLLQESKLPFVVAITKIDLQTANIESALQSLEKEGVYFEKRGGDISYIGISSKTGEGLQELLDLISLVSEMNEIKQSSDQMLNGFVIETVKDKRGLMVSIIVKDGKVKVGDIIFANEIQARVKAIFNSELQSVKEIESGYPAQILGFNELPEVGSSIAAQSQTAKQPIQQNTQAKDGKVKIFVKAKTSGSLEALLANIPEGVQVTGSGVGDVIENDIFFAKASGALIFLFEAKFASNIRKLAETEDVKMERFDVVYDLLERLKELSKVGQEEIIGQAQILATFPFNSKKVAGCKIISGKISKVGQFKLMRNDKELGRVRVTSIKKQKEEVSEVKQGEECGILFEPQLDFQPGDVLLSVNSSK